MNMADINGLGTYQTSPFAADNLALAKNMYGGRMAGATAQEQNILTNQANTVNNVEKNATDAATALAVMAATQGQADASFADLATKEAADRINRAGMVFNANQGMVAEGDKSWQDRLRQLQQKIGVRSVGFQNGYNAVSGIGSMASLAGNMWDYFKTNK